MKLTILGNNGPFPGAGGACSGYLITEGDTRLLIDCGSGVVSNVQRFTRLEELNAIVLTHLHSDHISDMSVLKYAIKVKQSKGKDVKAIDVFAPDEPSEEYNRLNLEGIFNLKTITEKTVLNYGALQLSFCEMKHPVKSLAIMVESGGKRMVFSGDTAWNENIIRFAKDCDLLMLDANLLDNEKKDDNVSHLTARECGVVAREAGVKKLLLTHLWPEYDVSDVLNEAKKEFENTYAAELLQSYDI
ncbi:MAG: MBL fold metallo-hydrolase [Clostridia bacterium]|nr:MBL fold metallo-hydrolase [Clostridia bacterium]